MVTLTKIYAVEVLDANTGEVIERREYVRYRPAFYFLLRATRHNCNGAVMYERGPDGDWTLREWPRARRWPRTQPTLLLVRLERNPERDFDSPDGAA